ncbi:MAG: hypothetical protein KDI21_20345 [Halieaceae bacterium]|nr:hypothetical protein [Halieaceae bacterium]
MRSLLLAVLLLAGQWSLAQEPVVTLRSKVTGEQQQPRVMYLVPWQQPGEQGFDYEMQAGFAEELFSPVDRDEFRRDLEYRELLGDATDTAAAAATNSNSQ